MFAIPITRTVQLQYMYITYTRSMYIYHIAEIDQIYFQPERAYLVRQPYTGVHREEDYCLRNGKIEWLVTLT